MRYFKPGEGLNGIESLMEKPFQNVEWYTQGCKPMPNYDQIVVANITNPLEDRMPLTRKSTTDLNSKGFAGPHVYPEVKRNSVYQNDTISNSNNAACLRTRSTKIICTLGRNTK